MEGALERKQMGDLRKHLGASIIGRTCARQIWYTWRWAKKTYHKARILRLFARGETEEEQVKRQLRQSGVYVKDKDPTTEQQWRVEDHDGHFGGSLDAILFDTPDYPGIDVLAEFKTHNDKSFNEVKKKRLGPAKYEHLVQMQLYMGYRELPHGLYFAVNKETDEIDVQLVDFDPTLADKYRARALAIIEAEVPPPRTPNAGLGWYICQFCSFRTVCLLDEPKEKNCRTCVHSKPDANKAWTCTLYRATIPDSVIYVGCESYHPIPE